MSEVIIYRQDNGVPAVIIPTPEAVAALGIMAIAFKDVPAGKPFKIIDAADLPDAPQEAWEVDDADLTDGVGGDYGAGSENVVVGWTPGGEPITEEAAP